MNSTTSARWCAALALLLALNVSAQERLHALILSGGGESRDWRASTAFLKSVLEDSRRFDVRINETPDGVTKASLNAFDLVIDNCGSAADSRAEKAIGEFVEGGKGLVVLRPALVAQRFPGLLKSGTHPQENPFGRFEMRSVRAEHLVMQGIKSSWRTADRLLRGMAVGEQVEVLATADEKEPALLAKKAGKGRVFATALGFDVGAMEEPAFITTFLRGAEWAAAGKVTMPSEMGIPGPQTNGVRALVITGGHDHYASFYGMFNEYTDLGWVPVMDSQIAFQKDIRAKYDVLIFYDFTRDMDDKAKQNLRDFVESGKGVVVLHHGILNFQKWPWWYEEVVGGLYRLERQGSIPNSTVKFGEQHLITPAGQHPITDGIDPFEVTDETYKGLFISDKVTPLLFTDNQTSDKTVAWIGPCKTSRVVFIQLGHDQSAFRHPSYRALVHNSILWSAGKLK